MFNHELKERFIQEANYTDARAKFARWLFDTTEKYEEQWGTDICTQPIESVRPVVDSVLGIRHRSFASAIAYLYRYCEWCLANGVENATDALLQIRAPSNDKFKTQMISNPTHLQEYLNALFEPESHKRIDNTYRCYFWLAYSGMPEDDIFLVKSSDIDFLHMIVKYNDNEYPIYEQAIPAMMNCVILSAFASTAEYLPKDNQFIQRGEGDILIRGTKPATSKGTLKPLLSKLASNAIKKGLTEQKLTYNKVWLSGLFFRMHERELDGYKVSFMSFSAWQLSQKYKDDPQREATISEIRKKSHEYLSDYKRWKKAFDI